MRINHASTLSVDYFVSYLKFNYDIKRIYFKRSYTIYEERIF